MAWFLLVQSRRSAIATMIDVEFAVHPHCDKYRCSLGVAQCDDLGEELVAAEAQR
jgi:hypothetical protein